MLVIRNLCWRKYATMSLPEIILSSNVYASLCQLALTVNLFVLIIPLELLSVCDGFISISALNESIDIVERHINDYLLPSDGLKYLSTN